jgi:hypothetical protein
VNVRLSGRLGWRVAAVVMAAQFLHGASVGWASVVVPLSLAEMTEAAAIVVDGTVAEVRTTQGPDGVERQVLVRVESVWKGQPEASVYVRLAGGQLGRLETRVPGVPIVAAGDRVVWFLTPHPHGGYVVIGLHQGALRTIAAPDGEPRVLAPSRTIAGRGDVRRAPRRVSDLASDVRALVAARRAP